MHVNIIGPNLRDQSKGDFHIHEAGCPWTRSDEYADHRDDLNLAHDVQSRIEVAEIVYADQIAEGSMTAADGVHTMWFAECCDNLPYLTPETFTATPSPSILVVGNPVDGITFVGPFDTGQWAADYAERHPDLRNETWWVAPIQKPVNQ